MDINSTFIIQWLETGLRLATPLILTACGGLVVERSGVINIGFEGMMLMGAWGAALGAIVTGNVWLATLFAMIVGGLMGLIHAYLTISRRANQIVSGAAINLLALGLTTILSGPLFQTGRVRAATYPIISPEFLRDVPVFGPLVFDQPVIVWIALIIPPIASWILMNTTWGLNLRAVGDHSKSVATAGISVKKYRYVAVILSGVFSGLGGSGLVLAYIGYFILNMTAGRGFIVLAAFVVGKWDPIKVALVCLLFGLADALQLRLQTLGSPIPYQFFVMIPYLLTIAALAGLVGRTVSPNELGKPYES